MARDTYWVVKELLSGRFIARSGSDAHFQEIAMSYSSDSRPDVGDTIMTTDGVPGYTMTVPISGDRPEFRYMNFHAPLEPEQDALVRDGTSEAGEGKQNFITHSPYSFRDIPAASKLLESKNGALVFAGDSMSGIAMTSSNKIILRDDNTMEIVSPHSVTLIGHTVTVSSFTEGFTLEIDILPRDAQGSSSLDIYRSSIHNKVKEGISYDVAFAEVMASASGQDKNIIDLFGIHIGDIVLSSTWIRIKMFGNIAHLVDSYFNGPGFNLYELAYYNGTGVGVGDLAYNRYIEVFLSEVTTRPIISLNGVPPCFEMQDTIVGLNCEIAGVPRSVTSMITHLNTGDVITYGKKLINYVDKNAIVGKELFISATIHKSTAETFHRDHMSELMEEIRIGTSGTSLCGQSISFNKLVFSGDTNIVVEGALSLFAQGSILMQAPSTTKILAGGKGLLIDSSGVSTTS